MLSIKNQNALKAVARSKKDPRFGEVNAELNTLIAQIMLEEHTEFHNKATLPERHFYGQPRGLTPHASYIVPFPN